MLLLLLYANIICDSSHPGLAASDRPGPNGPGLLIAAEDFGHTAVRNPQLSGDDARSDPVMGHFYYLVSDVVGQRTAVDEDPSKLVDSSLAQRSGH